MYYDGPPAGEAAAGPAQPSRWRVPGAAGVTAAGPPVTRTVTVTSE
jgi:hypothetical protein